MTNRNKFFHIIADNFSYKVVALFISLILWLTILGRRDFILTKNIDVELLVNPKFQLAAQTADVIKVKVSGTRSALKKFADSGASQTLTIDIGDRGEGVIDVEIPPDRIELPFGVKLISIRPNIIRVEVVKQTPKDKTSDKAAATTAK